MIKNRTSEFKRKYSTSQFDQTPSRNTTPENLHNKFKATGFTDFSVTTSAKKSTRKIAKVESSAFIHTRKQLQDFCITADHFPTLKPVNSTSLCQYLPTINNKNDRTPVSRYRMTPNQDESSQYATVQSPKLTPSKSSFREKPKFQYQQKNQIIIKAILDINTFFNSLTPRTLFFCCKCFKYIFAIQKNLHFPKCQNEINLTELTPSQTEEIGWQKLGLIKELAEYTNFKQSEIKRLFSRMEAKSVPEQIVIESGVSYLAFQKIIDACYLVYFIFLSGFGTKKFSIFDMGKIFSCSEPQQSQSGLYERGFFGQN